MKRFLIIGLLCSFALVSCSELRIMIDSQTPKGERTVCTSAVDLFRYKDGHVGMSLGIRYFQKDTIFALGIRYDAKTKVGVFDKGHRVLFRLTDNTEIALTNVWDKEYVEDVQTHVSEEYRHAYGYSYRYSPWGGSYFVAPYEIGAMVPTVTVEDNSASYGLYLINKGQFYDIVTKGVKKFRVESAIADFDMPDPTDLPATMIEIAKCLWNGVQTNATRTTF